MRQFRNRSDSRPVTLLLESFDFPFAGQRWDSFHLGPPGVLTFGEPFTNKLSQLYLPA